MTGAMMENVLEVRDLRTEFMTPRGPITAVNGVSFDLRRDETLGLVGESGSGKSVTGFSLLGLIDGTGRISGGSVKLNGTELVGMSQKELRKRRGREISMIFQDPIATLNPLLTVGDQMYLALRAHEAVSKKAAADRCADALNRVGIPSPRERLRQYPHEFSGGMRQRVAIATALLHRPSVVIADEPTTALDVSIQAQIMAETKELARDEGVAMIWISHDLTVVSSLASRTLVMYAGNIVEAGPTRQVLRDPHHPYTRGLIDSLPAAAQPGEPLTQIPGAMPAPGNLPAGCPFAPRCDRVTAGCGVLPELSSDGAERAWRCINQVGLSEEISA